jgi:hypothetical protein
MVVSEAIEVLEFRLIHLEEQLADYHAALAKAADQQDELVYKIAYSSAQLSYSVLEMVGGVALAVLSFILSEQFIDRDWAVITALVVFVAATGLGARGLLRAFHADVRKRHDALRPFPEWRSNNGDSAENAD